MFEDQELLYGNCHFDSIKKAMSNFWRVASDIREELGDKSYYLDEYLLIILSIIGSAYTSNVAFSGETIYTELLVVASSVCGSIVGRKSHELYNDIKKYIDDHPNNCLEIDTKSELYTSQFILDYVQDIVNSFKKELIDNSVNYNMPDYAISVDRFNQIVNIIGKEKAAHLESAIEDAFIISPVSLILVQSILTRLAEGLCLRDPQTSKQIFQLILDSKKK
jgi:hypothetical protein